jgi:hypothetical protein
LVGRPPKAFRLIGRPNGTFEVDAGHLQGVVCGTEFVVQDYNTESSSRQGLGILVADKVNADSSILVVRRGEAKFPVPERATALVLNWNNELKVFVHADSRQQVDPYTTPLPSEVDASQSRLVAPQDFVFVGSQFEADISIRLTPSAELHIERLNDLIPRYASRMTCIALDNEFGRLPLTLNAIAHFKHHLGRHHGADPLWKVSRNAYDPLKGVTMELYRLTRNAGFRVPDPSFGNLLIDNKASLPQDNEAEYGIAIINRSEHSLYPYLFYFDPSDYRIEVCSSVFMDWCVRLTVPLVMVFTPGPRNGTAAAAPSGVVSRRCHRWLRRGRWRCH